MRQRWGLKTRAEWAALPLDEREELLADDFRRQRIIADVRERVNSNEHGPMDLAWSVLLLLEQI